jgi:hypothetical protein
MTYRSTMEYAVRWTDGVSWKADQATFAHVTKALDAVRGSIEGLRPILDRWHSLSTRGVDLPVDDFCPTEGDRAIFTAAAERALEETRESPPDDEGATVERLAALHQLFMTDITRA